VPRIKESSLQELQSRVSILDVVQPHVQLERKGNRWWGLSPFTQEKTPSFSVSPEKGFYYCFSTGQGGDMFKFLQEVERLSFMEAVEVLADRFNIALEYEDGGAEPRQNRSLRREMEELHALAEDYYHACFMADNEQGRTMRTYWEEQRGFPLSLAEDFKVGFSPPDGGKLLAGFQKKGFSAESILQCGLFYANEGETDLRRLRPRFRGRLMIPIRDIQDRVIAFTARQTALTPENDPPGKYINSPETPLFKKSNVLFNLNRARKEVKRGEPFLLVEGQLDAMRCWEQGLRGTIAPQGTAVTEQQMRLLSRYTFRLEVLLDGDEAGQKAQVKTAALALQAGLETRFLPLPPGSDPDDLLREGGAEALEKLRGEAMGVIDFLLKRHLPKGFRSSPQERSEACREIFEPLASVRSPIERNAYLEELARKSGVEIHLLQEEFKRFSRQQRPSDTPANDKKNQAPSSKKLTTVAYELLLLILHNPALAQQVSELIDPQWLDASDLHSRLLDRVLAEHREQEWHDDTSIHELLENEEERNCIYGILAKGIDFEPNASQANECIRKLFNDFHQQKLAQVSAELANTPPDQEEKVASLYRQLKDIRAALRQPPLLPIDS